MFHIKYEGLHEVFFGCNKYGHKKENCPFISSPAPTDEGSTVVPTTIVSMDNKEDINLNESRPEPFADYGSWSFLRKLFFLKKES